MKAQGVGEVAASDAEPSERILIVEDNLVAVKVLKKKFCDSGFEEHVIDTVRSGEEAVDHVRAFKLAIFFLSADCVSKARAKQGVYQFIVMDICLAGAMDGFEATKCIRGFDKATPVIIVSAVNTPDWHSRPSAAGAQGLLTKPVTTEMVAEMLKGVDARPWAHVRRISDPCAVPPADFFALASLPSQERLGNALLAAVWNGDLAGVKVETDLFSPFCVL
jgi:CheY-like chemotaxis protein